MCYNVVTGAARKFSRRAQSAMIFPS
jgi:hypothetical protein